MTRAELRQLPWRTSSYTGNTGNCVEVAALSDGARLLRDTKDRDGGALAVGPRQWAAFLGEVKEDRLSE